MHYEHTQRGPLQYIFIVVAMLMAAGAWMARSNVEIMAISLVVAGVFLLTSLMFASLTVRDEGQRLAVRFGPLPLFRCYVSYADITAVEPAQSGFLDGLGVHYCRGGWIYNLWGSDCVKLTLGQKNIRIGTDDVENLVSFLRSKIAHPA